MKAGWQHGTRDYDPAADGDEDECARCGAGRMAHLASLRGVDRGERATGAPMGLAPSVLPPRVSARPLPPVCRGERGVRRGWPSGVL